jgi:hypothetical protein
MKKLDKVLGEEKDPKQDPKVRSILKKHFEGIAHELVDAGYGIHVEPALKGLFSAIFPIYGD